MTGGMRHRSGFTLIELLVTIAILLALAALVFLGVGRVRESAYASVCMNNMRQVAANQIALCNENNGVIAHANRTKVKGGPARVWQLHHTVLANDDLDWTTPSREVNERAEQTMEYLRCPTAYRIKKTEMDNLTGWRKVSTYALNGIIGSDFDPSDGTHPWIRGAYSLSSIENASTLVLAIEKEWATWGVYGGNAGPVAKVHVFAEFHNGGFNVAFYDGHVEKGKHGEFPIWTKKGFKYGDEEFFRYWIGMDSFR